jgi:DNA-binding GntR family transcriptional regulator
MSESWQAAGTSGRYSLTPDWRLPAVFCIPKPVPWYSSVALEERAMSLPARGPRNRDQASRQNVLADGAARRVQRPAPLRQAVYDAIVELIVQGTLQRGQHLVEKELAEYLGVSRQPVREALQRLQTDGWIELRPAQGAFVHIPSEVEVDQLLGVRSVLETYSARLAAERATPEDVNRLWELQQDGLNALAAKDPEALVAANAALHVSITALAGNAVLAEHIGLVERKWRWYYLPIAQPRGHDAWSEHAELIKAIAANDADQATDIMSRHTERTRQVYREQRLAKAGPE